MASGELYPTPGNGPDLAMTEVPTTSSVALNQANLEQGTFVNGLLIGTGSPSLGLTLRSSQKHRYGPNLQQLSAPVSPQRSPVSTHPTMFAPMSSAATPTASPAAAALRQQQQQQFFSQQPTPAGVQRSRSIRVSRSGQGDNGISSSGQRGSQQGSLLLQATSKLLSHGGTPAQDGSGHSTPNTASRRGTRYSIDYTTLTEMDRLRVLQQGDGWSKKGDSWGSSGTGPVCPSSPGGLHKGRSTRRHRRSTSRGSFRQNHPNSGNNNSNISNGQQQPQPFNAIQNSGKANSQAIISSPVLSCRTSVMMSENLPSYCSNTGQLLDPNPSGFLPAPGQHSGGSPVTSLSTSPPNPLGQFSTKHGNNLINGSLHNRRSVGRSQSVRTAKRPQTLDNNSRFRQRIASIPGERGAVGNEWDAMGFDSATSDRLNAAHAASNASSANSVYGGEGAPEGSTAVPENSGEVQRLRNFAVTSKGVVNRGDSFRSKVSRNRSLAYASAKAGARSVSLHREHASSLNRLNVPAAGTGTSQRQRSHSGGSYNYVHGPNGSGSNPELYTGDPGSSMLARVAPATALCAASFSDGSTRVVNQLQESARQSLAFSDNGDLQRGAMAKVEISGEPSDEGCLAVNPDLDVEPSDIEAVVDDVICVEPAPSTRRYRVLVVGAPETGKTSLTRQFTTSEYICSYDSSMDEEHEKAIQIILNGEESELVFIEHKSSEALRNPVTSYQPDAYLVVYSVTSKSSFLAAKDFLQIIRKWDNMAGRAVILVANKTDLVRLRAISTNEGRSFASSEGIKFIETSAGINHNVDELLAGLLHQIRLKQQQLIKRSASQRSQSSALRIFPLIRSKTPTGVRDDGPHDRDAGLDGGPQKQPMKAKLFLKKILRKACGTFGSTAHNTCDNLHVL